MKRLFKNITPSPNNNVNDTHIQKTTMTISTSIYYNRSTYLCTFIVLFLKLHLLIESNRIESNRFHLFNKS